MDRYATFLAVRGNPLAFTRLLPTTSCSARVHGVSLIRGSADGDTMKCNGTENTVEGEQPPAAASNDVPCEKGTTSNGSKEPSPSPHAKASPSLNDSLGQALDAAANGGSSNDPNQATKVRCREKENITFTMTPYRVTRNVQLCAHTRLNFPL